MPRSIISNTPFGGRNANVYEMSVQAEIENAPRLKKYRKNWRFFDGEHWQWGNEDDDALCTFNFIRMFVDFQISFLFSGGVSFLVPDDPATPNAEDEDREFVRRALADAWDSNGGPAHFYEVGQQASVTGDLFWKVGWDEGDAITAAHPRIDALPSQFVFPIFGGPHGVDRKRVTKMIVVYPTYTELEHTTPKRIRGMGRKNLEIRIEVWEDHQYTVYNQGKPPEIKPNPWKVIPIVHVANLPRSGDSYGISDVDDLVLLQQQLNEKATEISDVINYMGSPVTVVKGAKLSQLERGANRMWGIPEDASVELLTLEGDMGLSMKFIEFVKDAMHQLQFAPASLFTGDTSNTSAAALAMRYFPLLYRRKVKIAQFTKGMERVNKLVLRVLDLKDDEFHAEFSKLKKDKYRNEVKFGPPFPRDEIHELEKSEKRLDLRLSSRAEEMEGMGKSQSQIKKTREDWEADLRADADIELSVGQKFMPQMPARPEQKNRSGNPNPKRKSTDVVGAAKSRATEKDATRSM